MKIRKYDTNCLNQFKTKLINSNIYDKLNKDKDTNPNNNYSLLDEIITTAMDTFYQLKLLNTINTSTKSHVGLRKASPGQ